MVSVSNSVVNVFQLFVFIRSHGHCRPSISLMKSLFPVPDSQPTATELFQSPLYGSGTVFRRISHLLRYFLSSNYGCRAREVTLSFMDALIALTYLLTYFISKIQQT